MDLVSIHEDSIILYRSGMLVSRCMSTGKVTELEMPRPIVFVSMNYLVDAEKNLLVLEGGTVRNVLKLKRNIFCLLQHDGAMYAADRFGDVYRIQDGVCEYVLGTLSYSTGLVIHGGNILVSDKYGRIRISGMDGKILDYIHCSEPVVSLMCVGGRLVSVGNKQVALYNNEYAKSSEFELPRDTQVLKAVPKGENEFVVICSDGYLLFRVGETVELVLHADETMVDCVCHGSKLYKVQSDHVVDGDSNEVLI